MGTRRTAAILLGITLCLATPAGTTTAGAGEEESSSSGPRRALTAEQVRRMTTAGAALESTRRRDVGRAADPLLERLRGPAPRSTARGAPDVSAVDEFPLNEDASGFGTLDEIAAGPDGNLWVLGNKYDPLAPDKIGRIAPDGASTEFDIGPAGVFGGFSFSSEIAAGPDGAMWFTQYGAVGRMEMDGDLTYYAASRPIDEEGFPEYQLGSIATGPDGALWMTAEGINAYGVRYPGGIVRFETDGDYVFYPLPGGVTDIMTGPDGQMWFTWVGPQRSRVGRIAMDGTTSWIVTPLMPRDIAAGPHGTVWVTLQDRIPQDVRAIGRISPDLSLTTFSDPSLDHVVLGAIGAGPDGSMWFSETHSRHHIGRITPDGRIDHVPAPVQGPLEFAAGGPGDELWFVDGYPHVGRISGSDAVGFVDAPRFATSIPAGMVAGPDNELWYVLTYSDEIGRMALDGSVLDPIHLRPGSHPIDIALGPDGNYWVTEAFSARIARVSPSGEITRFRLPDRRAYPYSITAGPDGRMWFVEQHRTITQIFEGSSVGRISMDGSIKEFSVADENRFLSDIVAGPDDALWFVGAGSYFRRGDVGRSVVGRISTTGDVTKYPVLNDSDENPSAPVNITAGPDGHLWFTDNLRARIGRLTTGGTVDYFHLDPFLSFGPNDIAWGPDGAYWFTGDGAQIGRITTDGVISRYMMPIQGWYGSVAIVTGPDGALWISQYGPGSGLPTFPGHIARVPTDIGSVFVYQRLVPPTRRLVWYGGDLGSFSVYHAHYNGTALEPGTYVVKQDVDPRWPVTRLACADPDGGTTVHPFRGTATVDLDLHESIICVFRNTRRPMEGTP